jgi:MFS family permease
MRLPRMLEPLRIRDFALLWSGMTVSLVGDYVFLVAFAWEAYELSNTPQALGWISAAYSAPMIAFLLAGGVLTDRIERRRMMIAADLIRMLASGAAGVLAITGQLQLWQFAFFVALMGVGAALFAPAFGSIVPEIVPTEQLAQANSLDQFVRPAAGLVGPALGGIIIAVSDAGWALVFDSATFVFSVVTAAMLGSRPLARIEGRSVVRDVRAGLSFVLARPWIWATFLTAALMNVATAARTVLLPDVVKNEIHASARGLGIAYSSVAVGALLSSYAYGQRGLPRRHVAVMYLGWTAALFAIGAFGVARNVPELAAYAFAGGVGLALGQAIWGTMMHRLVPREMLGRVTSIDWLTSMSLVPLCSAVAGFVAAGIGSRATLVGAGLLSGVATLLALLFIPGLRDSENDGSMASGPAGEAIGEAAGESAEPE